jgi:hypothetical protein
MTSTNAPSRAVRMDRVGDLTNGARLAPLLGPVVGIDLAPLPTVGYSGSRHRRMRVNRVGADQVRLVLKLTSATSDWTHRMTVARRSREADLLKADELAGVWSIFGCPYLAFAEEGPETGLLMLDLSAHLFPDVREPISIEAEDLLLRSFARLHGQYWAVTLPAVEWMTSFETFRTLIGPNLVGHAFADLLPNTLRPAVIGGWEEALRRAPPKVAAHLRSPAPERLKAWRALPHTLVHGDAKLANFAVLPDQRVAAFDWALIGWAPASVDLGWYLAVNASRLARSKEDVIAMYRRFLEIQLGLPFAAAEWSALEDAAIEIGARMLLWSKANAAANGDAPARTEWEWWMERLARML